MSDETNGRFKDSLAPGFIAAMPQLTDPNFHRSVVLVLRHSEAGAFGLIVNRPATITVADLCRSQDIPATLWGGLPLERVLRRDKVRMPAERQERTSASRGDAATGSLCCAARFLAG